MTTKLPRIQTPLIQHFRRIRYQLIPVLTLCAAILGTGWLWQRFQQFPNAVGEVEVIRIPVRAQFAGKLAPIDGGVRQVFDQVKAGETVAGLDDAANQAALEALRFESERLELDLASTAEKISQEDTDREYTRNGDARRLSLDVETNRLTIVGLQTDIASDNVALARLSKLLASTEKALAAGAGTVVELEDLRLQRDRMLEQVRGYEKQMLQAEANLKSAQDRLTEMPTSQPAAVGVYLAPIRKALAAQEARVKELQLQIACRGVCSPIDGTICAILRHPGQSVAANEDIMIIAATRGDHIVTYIRQEQRLQPKEGMMAKVSTRTAPGQPVMATVEKVGPQVEEVPLHQRRDATRPEWGLPVQLSVPVGVALRPGELVDIAFQTN